MMQLVNDVKIVGVPSTILTIILEAVTVSVKW